MWCWILFVCGAHFDISFLVLWFCKTGVMENMHSLTKDGPLHFGNSKWFSYSSLEMSFSLVLTVKQIGVEVYFYGVYTHRQYYYEITNQVLYIYIYTPWEVHLSPASVLRPPRHGLRRLRQTQFHDLWRFCEAS